MRHQSNYHSPMKISPLIIVLLLLSVNLNAQKDTSLATGTGWLFYWKGYEYYFPSDINSKVKDEEFFLLTKEYRKGLYVNYSFEARLFRAIAKGYAVEFINKGAHTFDSIWVLPVKVRYKTGFQADSEATTLNFQKGKNNIAVYFKGNEDYDVREVELLRNTDKRKLRKLKSYSVPPPN
jgi:hypothetical protein